MALELYRGGDSHRVGAEDTAVVLGVVVVGIDDDGVDADADAGPGADDPDALLGKLDGGRLLDLDPDSDW